MRLVRRRNLIAVVLLAVLLLAIGAALALSLAHRASSNEAPTVVKAPDSSNSGLSDVASNSMGVIGRTNALPAGWIARYHLDLSDANLSDRDAPYPRPPDSPAAYGSKGLPSDFRMTYGDVYAFQRPASWNESRDGPWDSKLDPTKWDVGGSGVPYSWLAHFGIDPFDASAVDRVVPGANVTWTPRFAYDHGLSPLDRDSNHNGIDDDVAASLGLDPLKYSTADSDVADGWLVRWGLNASDPALPYQDLAHSGMTVKEKFEASLQLYGNASILSGGLDPRRMSTAGGPIPDGWLLKYGLDPLDPNVASVVVQKEDITNATGTHHYELTVLDCYQVDKPPTWNETRNGPWWGGIDPHSNLSASGLTNIEAIVGWDIVVNGKTRHVTSDPTKFDTDGDGLSDKEKHDGLAVRGTRTIKFPPLDPHDPDPTGSGLTDAQKLGIEPYKGHTLPQLDPLAQDTAHQGLKDGEAADYWIARYDDCVAQKAYPWGADPRPTTAEALFAAKDASACSKLLPESDLRGSGTPNILNPDADGDGLLNGWEIHPDEYRTSPYAPREGDPDRSATDPANANTPGNGLNDGWEVKFGLPFPDAHGWNLDPSKWSSFDDNVSDGDRDLLHDMVTWYSYKTGTGGTQAVAHFWNATNKIKFQHGGNPNLLSSSPDGIPDAWKIFWGQIYPTLDPSDLGDLYPGAPGDLHVPAERPAPRIGFADDTVLRTLTFARYLLNDDTNKSSDACTTHVIQVRTAQGAKRSICYDSREIAYTYASAWKASTNPYLDDTDGDGLPDVWEATWASLYPGQTGVSPVLPDAHGDPDGDGLDNTQEYLHRTNPYELDSDFLGVSDLVKIQNGIDPMDPTADVAKALNSSHDSDGDGIPDAVEQAGFLDAAGDVVKTDPNDPDSDHDGLLDGRSLSLVVGHKLHASNATDATLLATLEARGLLIVQKPDGSLDVLGEQDCQKDPTRFSTTTAGAPDSWLCANPDDTAPVYHYTYGRPAWWNESQDGIWRWGLATGETPTEDHDHDGLNDINGEDPVAFASPTNQLPRGDPLDPGLGPLERLMRSQAYGNGYRTFFGGERNLTIPTSPLPRATPILTLAPLPSTLIADGGANFSGTLKVGNVPVVNATVVLSAQRHDFVLGVAITSADGSFQGTILAASTLLAPPNSTGVPVFAGVNGTTTHDNDASLLGSMDIQHPVHVFAWAYNESWFPTLPRQNHTYPLSNGKLAPGILFDASTAPSQDATLVVPTSLQSESAVSGGVGSAAPLNATLDDAFGRALVHRNLNVTLWDGSNVTAATDASGRIVVALTLPGVPGDYSATISFQGDAGHLGAAQNVTIHVTKATVVALHAPSQPLPAGSRFALRAQLLTGSGEPLANRTLTTQIGDQVYENATGDDGVIRLEVDLAPSAVGRLAISTSYAGDAKFDGSTASTYVDVVGQPSWRTQIAAGDLQAPITIVGQLVDRDSHPISGAAFTVTDEHGRTLMRGVTSAAGLAQARLNFSGSEPGERHVFLAFSDPVAGSATAAVTVVLETPTSVTLDTTPIVRGAPTLLAGALRTIDGGPVLGQVVLVQVADQSVSAITDANGRYSASFDSVSLRPGPAQASVTFPGSSDGLYHASSASAGIVVRDAPRFAPDRDVVDASRPTLRGTLTTLAGEPLASTQVTIQTRGGLTAAITDRAGRASIALKVPADQPLGPMIANLTSTPASYLDALNETLALTLKDKGTLTLDLPAASTSPGSVQRPYAVLDSRGRSVPDAVLRATLDGKPVPVSLASGVAKFDVPGGFTLGPHTLGVAVDSAFVDVPPASGPMTIRQPTQIDLLSSAVAQAGVTSPVLTVTLRSNGAPVPNATLLVVGDGPVPIQVTTDEAGHADVHLHDVVQAKSVTLSFPGEGQYAASSTQVTMHVAPAAPAGPSWLTLTLLLIALVVLAIVARRVWLRLRPERAAESALRRAARVLNTKNADIRILYSIYLELLAAARLSEEQADLLTFGGLLDSFLDDPAALRAERDLLVGTFERVCYANERVDEATFPSIARALDQLAAHVRERTPSAA